MMKNWKINGTEEIGFVTPTPGRLNSNQLSTQINVRLVRIWKHTPNTCTSFTTYFPEKGNVVVYSFQWIPSLLELELELILEIVSCNGQVRLLEQCEWQRNCLQSVMFELSRKTQA